jgi:hypothetical protein
MSTKFIRLTTHKNETIIVNVADIANLQNDTEVVGGTRIATRTSYNGKLLIYHVIQPLENIVRYLEVVNKDS